MLQNWCKIKLTGGRNYKILIQREKYIHRKDDFKTARSNLKLWCNPFPLKRKNTEFNTSIRVNDPNKLHYRLQQWDRSCHGLQCWPHNVQGQQHSLLPANNTMSSMPAAAAVFAPCLLQNDGSPERQGSSRKHTPMFLSTDSLNFKLRLHWASVVQMCLRENEMLKTTPLPLITHHPCK